MTFIGGSFGQIAPFTGGSGGGGGTPVTYAPAYQKSLFESRNNNATLPQGALYVQITNMDVSGTITVNGKTLRAGERWSGEAFTNLVDRTTEFVEEVTILSSGVEYLLRVAYPSSNSVDVNNI